MLDRLSAGLVTLPDSTYDLILILTDADGTRTESSQLLGRDVFGRIAQALKAGGKLQAQDGTFGQNTATAEIQEGILAGLICSRTQTSFSVWAQQFDRRRYRNGMTKPASEFFQGIDSEGYQCKELVLSDKGKGREGAKGRH